jgi:hypothetical protein
VRVPGDRAGGRTERRYCKPFERLITVRTVNYPEWNPGERLIIRKGFWGTDNVLAHTSFYLRHVLGRDAEIFSALVFGVAPLGRERG